jgi:hypothetical protein
MTNKERLERLKNLIGADDEDIIHVCRECGNPDISERRWVAVNTGYIEEIIDNDGTVFCDVCETETKCMDLKEYEKLKGIGDI